MQRTDLYWRETGSASSDISERTSLFGSSRDTLSTASAAVTYGSTSIAEYNNADLLDAMERGDLYSSAAIDSERVSAAIPDSMVSAATLAPTTDSSICATPNLDNDNIVGISSIFTFAEIEAAIQLLENEYNTDSIRPIPSITSIPGIICSTTIFAILGLSIYYCYQVNNLPPTYSYNTQALTDYNNPDYCNNNNNTHCNTYWPAQNVDALCVAKNIFNNITHNDTSDFYHCCKSMAHHFCEINMIKNDPTTSYYLAATALDLLSIISFITFMIYPLSIFLLDNRYNRHNKRYKHINHDTQNSLAPFLDQLNITIDDNTLTRDVINTLNHAYYKELSLAHLILAIKNSKNSYFHYLILGGKKLPSRNNNLVLKQLPGGYDVMNMIISYMIGKETTMFSTSNQQKNMPPLPTFWERHRFKVTQAVSRDNNIFRCR